MVTDSIEGCACGLFAVLCPLPLSLLSWCCCDPLPSVVRPDALSRDGEGFFFYSEPTPAQAPLGEQPALRAEKKSRPSCSLLKILPAVVWIEPVRPYHINSPWCPPCHWKSSPSRPLRTKTAVTIPEIQLPDPYSIQSNCWIRNGLRRPGASRPDGSQC